VLTGHYDHLGVRGTGEGDHIYNGANDDASGTSSVIEIAKALASLPQRPRRSIVFMTLFGEELGDLGSRYYCQHPVFPLAKTIANINLEQLGRTDDTEGPRLLQFNLTGFDYTDIAAYLSKAGEETGIRVVKHEKNSDSFFRPQRQRRLCRRRRAIDHAFGQLHLPGLSPPRRRMAQARLRQHGQSGWRGGVGRFSHGGQHRSPAVEQSQSQDQPLRAGAGEQSKLATDEHG